MQKLWFKRKRYGWGWRPATWQGWVVTAGYVAGVLFFASTIGPNPNPREWFFMLLLPFLILSVTFIRIAYKTGEAPRWQWGESKDTTA